MAAKDGNFPHAPQPFARHQIVGLDPFHGVAEEIHADGIFRIDGIDVEDIAAERKRTFRLHLVAADIPQTHQLRGHGSKIRVLALPPAERGKLLRKQLNERVDFGRHHGAAALKGVNPVQSPEQGILGQRLTVEKHLVLGGQRRRAFPRQRRDTFGGPLRGYGVRRDIHDGKGKQGGEQIFQRVGDAENRRGRAAADIFSEQGILPSYFVKGKKVLFHRSSLHFLCVYAVKQTDQVSFSSVFTNKQRQSSQ